MAAVAALECCGVKVLGTRVRDEARVPEALRGVEQAELSTWVRTFAPADKPCVFTPGGQVHEICELCHPCSVPVGPVRDGAWVAELTDLMDLSAWGEDARLICRRERPHPGAQLSLFDTSEGFRHTCFIT